MYNWGFVLMAAVPMIVTALVLRRLIFGKDGSLSQTFVAVMLTWALACIVGALGMAEGGLAERFANADWSGAWLGYAKPTVLVAVILGAMAFIRTRA